MFGEQQLQGPEQLLVEYGISGRDRIVDELGDFIDDGWGRFKVCALNNAKKKNVYRLSS